MIKNAKSTRNNIGHDEYFKIQMDHEILEKPLNTESK